MKSSCFSHRSSYCCQIIFLQIRNLQFKISVIFPHREDRSNTPQCSEIQRTPLTSTLVSSFYRFSCTDFFFQEPFELSGNYCIEIIKTHCECSSVPTPPPPGGGGGGPDLGTPRGVPDPGTPPPPPRGGGVPDLGTPLPPGGYLTRVPPPRGEGGYRTWVPPPPPGGA